MSQPNTTEVRKNRTTSWLTEPESDKFGTLLWQHVADDKIWNRSSIHWRDVNLAYTHFYGGDVEAVGANASLITPSGDQGSISEIRIPNAASMIKKVHDIVTGPELSWSTVATTTDFASESKALTARSALQYYWNDKDVSSISKLTCLSGLVFAEGALHIPWDEHAGEDSQHDASALADDGKSATPLKTGDIAYHVIDTWDIIRDNSASSWESMTWIIVREWQNKYDVAATVEDPIKKAACIKSVADPDEYCRPFPNKYLSDTDLIPVYYLYAKRTASLPTGRQSKFLSTGVILEDDILDQAYHKELPVVRYAAGEYAGTPLPYTKFFACLGAQQASDSLYRDLLTNAQAVSRGIIFMEGPADNAPVTQLAGGPKMINAPEGTKEPKVLQLSQPMPEHFQLINKYRQEVQQIMGIDSLTANLDEADSQLSGAAMALKVSTSVQNNSNLQFRWVRFCQAVGTITLRHIQYHMKEPRRVILAGQSRSSLVTSTELSGDAVRGVDRAQVTIGPAMTQTDAGRYQLAQDMIKQGWVQTPQQFQTVMDTGRMDALTQDLSNQLLMIASENEALSKGQTVPVMLLDDHILHLKLHRAVTASLSARQDPKVVAAAQAHEDKHMEILRGMDPGLAQALGIQQPPPPAPPPGQPPPGTGAPGSPEPQAQAQKAGPSLPQAKVPQPGAGSLPPAMANRSVAPNGTMPPNLAVKIPKGGK